METTTRFAEGALSQGIRKKLTSSQAQTLSNSYAHLCLRTKPCSRTVPQGAWKLPIELWLSAILQLVPPSFNPSVLLLVALGGLFSLSKAQRTQQNRGVSNCTCLSEFYEDDMK